jgi:DNA primase
VDRLLPIVAAISDPIRQAHYLQKLAGLVKVDLNTIKSSLSRLKQPAVRRRTPAAKPARIPQAARPLVSTSREEYLLALLLQHPGLKNEIEELSPEYFESSENREIFNTWREVADIPSLKEKLDPAIHERLDVIIERKLPETRNNIEQKLADSIMRLKEKYLKNIAARKAESGEADTDPARLEEDVQISVQLKELDARKSQKRTGARR